MPAVHSDPCPIAIGAVPHAHARYQARTRLRWRCARCGHQPINLADDTGKPLDGGRAYVLHFEKGATPPVDAFWSITLYDSEGFQVANSLNRFAISSWMPLKYGEDGSLDLYFQNASPGADSNRQPTTAALALQCCF